MIKRSYFYSGFIIVDNHKEYFDGIVSNKSLFPSPVAVWEGIRNNQVEIMGDRISSDWITITTLNRI